MKYKEKNIKYKRKIIGILLLMLMTNIPVMAYVQTNLVSDIPGLAKITDPNLVNSWGIAHSPTSPWWVADNGMGVATVYNGTGIPFPVGNPLVVTIPGLNGSATPTGIVFNNGSGFNVTPGNPARFIFVTEDGTIAAWNPNVDLHNASIVVNNSMFRDVYKGVTIAEHEAMNMKMLYVANFRNATIDVYDQNFNKMNMPFIDPDIPQGFAPFNIINIGDGDGKLVVTYAKQGPEKHDELDGKGLGFVDIFDIHGNLLMRLKHGPWMNAPWGVTLAPSNFGKFSQDLLIGNFGSGQIAAFDANNGHFKGLMKKDKGKAITIDGLWGLGFGNDANAGPSNTLFFAAGINHEADGLFGMIVVQ